MIMLPEIAVFEFDPCVAGNMNQVVVAFFIALSLSRMLGSVAAHASASSPARVPLTTIFGGAIGVLIIICYGSIQSACVAPGAHGVSPTNHVSPN